MKVVTELPRGLELARTYPRDVTIKRLEEDLELLAKAGRGAIVYLPDGRPSVGVYLELPAQSARAEAALSMALADVDAALEPHDPGARRRDRAPELPADAPHSVFSISSRVRE